MKKHNNTALICLTLGLLTGSVIAGLMINPDWFVLSVILALSLGIFYTTHGEQDISTRTKNTFKKKTAKDMNIEKFKKLGFEKDDSYRYIKTLNRDWSISVDLWHNNDRKLVFSATLYIDGDTFIGIDSDDDIIRLASGMIDPQKYYDSM